MAATTGQLIWVGTIGATIAGLLVAVLSVTLVRHQRRLFDQATEWGRHLLEAQEADRRHVAQNLHDDIGQRLWAARMRIESGEVKLALDMLREAAVDVRSLSRQLYPANLSTGGLAAAIEDLVALRQGDGGVTIVPGIDPVATPPAQVAIAFYRVAQEALHNALKHSHAGRIEVSLQADGGELLLRVADDGDGFEPTGSRARGFGIRSMEERLAVVGGTLAIESNEGRGTVLEARCGMW